MEQKYPKFQSEYEDAYWRQKAKEQQELKRNLIILGIGAAGLIWMFSGAIIDY